MSVKKVNLSEFLITKGKEFDFNEHFKKTIRFNSLGDKIDFVDKINLMIEEYGGVFLDDNGTKFYESMAESNLDVIDRNESVLKSLAIDIISYFGVNPGDYSVEVKFDDLLEDFGEIIIASKNDGTIEESFTHEITKFIERSIGLKDFWFGVYDRTFTKHTSVSEANLKNVYHFDTNEFDLSTEEIPGISLKNIKDINAFNGELFDRLARIFIEIDTLNFGTFEDVKVKYGKDAFTYAPDLTYVINKKVDPEKNNGGGFESMSVIFENGKVCFYHDSDIDFSDEKKKFKQFLKNDFKKFLMKKIYS